MVSFVEPYGRFDVLLDGSPYRIFWRLSRPEQVGDQVLRFASSIFDLDDAPTDDAMVDLPGRVASCCFDTHIKYRHWRQEDGFPSQPSSRTAVGRGMDKHNKRLCDYTRFATIEQMARYLRDGIIPEE